jgi:response regulator of citrate/malate metabolism
MASTILIVEDEVELAQVLRDYLEKASGIHRPTW